MIKTKTIFLKMVTLLMIAVTITSFNGKPFVLDGGTITNPFITFNPNTTPPPIIATEASGCTGTITYQWQQSFDATNFMDIAGANGINYQPQTMANTTYFRRKAICSGGGTAYTSNIATAMIVMPSQ